MKKIESTHPLYKVFLKTMERFERKYVFSTHTKIAVAVSGGSDSLALLLLLTHWCKNHNISLTAITVNHNFRTEAQAEAEYVAKICKSLQIHHVILKNHAPSPTSNIMAQARDLRYQLLENYCTQHSILFLFVAHHLDDQIETYQLMENRSKSPYGMASMFPLTHRNNICVMRPLLNIKKEKLKEFLITHSVKWIEDPTNKNTHYKRNNIRSLNMLSNVNYKLFNTHILHHQQQKITAEKHVSTFLAHNLTLSPYGTAQMDLSQLTTTDNEIILRALSRIITMVSGKKTRPRFHKLKQLLNQITSIEQQKFTLHGVVITRNTNNYLTFYREPSDINHTIPLSTSSYLWDGRFSIQTHPSSSENFIATQLSENDRVFVKQNNRNKHRFRSEIVKTFPCIKIKEQTLEKIVALPHINFYITETMTKDFYISFTPQSKLTDVLLCKNTVNI